ncbi:putative ascorbate peroxidase [Clytia hemisphaerica]|uniref:Plant heme peroxidase family profile domain-containing protein n=1 Tax=Clytia hemisphaerica TaxID=252671 RepID=A0A7M6DPC3_9CNID
MKKTVLLFLLVCRVFGQNVVKKASIETLDNLATQIREKIDGNPRLAAGFVRLSFHDCVGEDRCDGCINYQEPDNAGIPRYTAVLNDLYEPVKNDITRADLYAYAGVVAANYASSRDAVFDMTKFKVGRHDCSESGDETDLDEHFPSNNFQNVEELHAYFNKEFGLSLQESVALMGAHSLGRMETANSGYEGPWVPGTGQDVLNSDYYREVVNVPWFLKTMPTNSAKHQWQRRAPSLGVGNSPGQNRQPDNVLLNTDAALAVNLQLNQDTGAFQDGAECVMCPPNRRPPPGGIPCCDEDTPGREICSQYITDNPGWMCD